MAVIDIYLNYDDHHHKKGPAIVCMPQRYGPDRFVCSARAGMEQLQERAKRLSAARTTRAEDVLQDIPLCGRGSGL